MNIDVFVLGRGKHNISIVLRPMRPYLMNECPVFPPRVMIQE